MQWQTKEQLTELLVSLVQHGSVTLSEQEKKLAAYIYEKLCTLRYFQQNEDKIQLNKMNDNRAFVTALYKHEKATDTIVLLSHFDVVGIEDYGLFKNLAFQPIELTKKLYENVDLLPDEAKDHLLTGDWLYGRGTMDMKAGLTVQMGLLERAIHEQWQVNLLLLTVPDEEVNSEGMISALPVLNELANKHNFTYKACINSEPMFQLYPGDDHLYLYTGSIGKIMPGFFCYGKETHVGESLLGLNANLMVSEINRLMEWNIDLCEQVGSTVTPPPTNLVQKDLKDGYSVQIPHTAVTLFNVQFLKKSLQEWEEAFKEIAFQAANNIMEHTKERIEKLGKKISFVKPNYHVSVYTYSELLRFAVEKFSEEEIAKKIQSIIVNCSDDVREQSIKVVEELASLCKEKGPMIILFYAPPFYPAVATEEKDETMQAVHTFLKEWKEKGTEWTKTNYFSGLCDLSFIGNANLQAHDLLETNIPVYGKAYSLPFEEMKAIQMPVYNLGPVGKDAHKWTERLHTSFSFSELPEMLDSFVKRIAKIE
ncbi:M20/M25/M40 family metallo-hydrolase [Sutcliffiella cohnii]